MTLVRELADGLNLIAEVVQNTQSLVKAIRDGHEYLGESTLKPSVSGRR